MNDEPGVKGKLRRAVTAVAGATVSEVLGNELAPNSNAVPAAEAHPLETPPAENHEWVPEAETSTVTHGADGSVGVRTGTVWHPAGAPAADTPTIEEFEQIDVREDAFGNFVVDATERVVVHQHGHDEVYEDHQHVVVPGDGTPGDTDLAVSEREDVVVHENPDGSISVEHHGSLSVETRPDAPGHGDVDVWQTETVALDPATTGPPGIDAGVSEQEQATVDDPFGEPAGPVIHQDESVGEIRRGTGPAPVRPVSTVDPVPVTVAPVVAQPLVSEATATVAPPHPKTPVFVTHHPAARHDPGELTGPKPVHHQHDAGTHPHDVGPLPHPAPDAPPELPEHEPPGPSEDVHEHAPEPAGHDFFHGSFPEAHADGGG